MTSLSVRVCSLLSGVKTSSGRVKTYFHSAVVRGQVTINRSFFLVPISRGTKTFKYLSRHDYQLSLQFIRSGSPSAYSLYWTSSLTITVRAYGAHD